MANKPILITVSGPSASGKSTVVQKIMKLFQSEDISVICMDNYYKERNDIPLEERKKINYDHPDSFDIDLLYQDLSALLNQKPIEMPVYDFKRHNRDQQSITRVEPTRVIILEGILTLYDSKIRDLSDIKIFVESDADTCFIRRLKRDIAERGRTMEDVIQQYLSTVKPMYEAYVAPTKRFADIIIPNYSRHDVAIGVLAAKIKEIIQ